MKTAWSNLQLFRHNTLTLYTTNTQTDDQITARKLWNFGRVLRRNNLCNLIPHGTTKCDWTRLRRIPDIARWSVRLISCQLLKPFDKRVTGRPVCDNVLCWCVSCDLRSSVMRWEQSCKQINKYFICGRDVFTTSSKQAVCLIHRYWYIYANLRHWITSCGRGMSSHLKFTSCLSNCN